VNIRRCYEILELERGASIDEVKQAYKDIVNVWHPDRFSNNLRLKQKAENKLKEANAAYETVKLFLSSNEELEPEQKESSRSEAGAGARDKTEAVAETGTRIVLSLWSYLSATIRQIIDKQVSKIEKEESLRPGGPNRSKKGGGMGRGKGVGRGREGAGRRERGKP